jgi:LacI family transcriptional regulator
MVRIKDIAKEAQVSEGTVDRVLHNRGGVSSKTEAKIKKILENRNFSINPVASALAMKNKHNIAVLIPGFTDLDTFWRLPYLGVLKAAEEVEKMGVNVNVYNFNQYDSLSYRNAFNVLFKTKPEAVLIVPVFLKETKSIVGQLQKLHIPYMFLNIDLDGFGNEAFIGQDSYTAGYIAGKLMHLSSPQQSTFLTVQTQNNMKGNNAISKRIQGFNDYFIKNNANKVSLTLKIDNLNNPNEVKEKISSRLNQHAQVKGVFVPSSRIYMIVDCITDVELKKLTLIGFDNTPQNVECLKNNTVAFLISQKPFDQGYQSIRIMADFLIKKIVPENKIYLPIDILMKENLQYDNRNEFILENDLRTHIII